MAAGLQNDFMSYFINKVLMYLVSMILQLCYMEMQNVFINIISSWAQLSNSYKVLNLTEQRSFCFFTLSYPVSKQHVHSSMTTLSGLPKAARVAAWQRSILFTVMSPSIHSFVSELCQERQRHEEDWETATVIEWERAKNRPGESMRHS